MNEEQVFGMDLAGLRKQRTCRAVERYVRTHCPYEYKLPAGPPPPPPKMMLDGSGSSKNMAAPFSHCINPSHCAIIGIPKTSTKAVQRQAPSQDA